MVSKPWSVVPHSISTTQLSDVPRYSQVNGLQTQFTSIFAEQEFSNFTVNGAPAGLFKNAGTFSYVRIFGAGHEVPAYEFTDVPRGAAALQFFSQIMSNQSLSGT